MNFDLSIEWRLKRSLREGRVRTRWKRASASAEVERKLSVRINVVRRLHRVHYVPGNIGNNSNERPPRTC